VLTQLLDVFGFISVLLRGCALALQSLVLGGVVFGVWILVPLTANWKSQAAAVIPSCRRLIFWSCLAFALVESCSVAADAALLIGTSGLSLGEVAGANFFIAGVAGVLAALVAAAIAAPSRWLLAPAAVILSALVATSHAASRLEHRPALIAVSALHQLATACWVGGLPYLLLGLARSEDFGFTQALCRRFSRMAMISVAVLAAAGCVLSLAYVRSPDAVYGTSYGAMVASKVIMLGLLLGLGALNFWIVRHPGKAADGLLLHLRRFAEAEVGIGFTVIFAAASLTSQPPAVDLTVGRVTGAAIVQRMSPRWPRLETPPVSALSPATPLGFGDNATRAAGLQSFVPGTSYHPNGPGDIAWSEFNHHWAGLIVLVAGLLAVAARGRRLSWARNWPLAFLGLAVFLFLRADPENWPLGPRSFWQSFAVAEVLQHRLIVLLIVAFAFFEWAIATGRLSSPKAALVFPSVCAAGGALLLTHTHPLGNIQEELLVELNHIPLGLLAVTAGWTRWLELRVAGPPRRVFSWIWPVCFVLIGVLLLNYRES
jgi:putative copper resistance protein D